MNKTIIHVGGNKGRTGKLLVASATFALYNDSKLREDIERCVDGLVLFPILPRGLAFAVNSDLTDLAAC